MFLGSGKLEQESSPQAAVVSHGLLNIFKGEDVLSFLFYRQWADTQKKGNQYRATPKVCRKARMGVPAGD